MSTSDWAIMFVLIVAGVITADMLQHLLKKA
jgi:hypothetical protein